MCVGEKVFKLSGDFCSESQSLARGPIKIPQVSQNSRWYVAFVLIDVLQVCNVIQVELGKQ